MEEKQETKKSGGLFSNSKLFQKLKGVKHIELILALVLGAIIIVIYISSLGTDTSQQSSTQNFSSISEYSAFLENKLANVLAQINGAGNVSAMITFETGTEYVYANNEESKINTNTSSNSTTSTTTTSTSPNEELLIKEILPKISGVIIVASGAKDTNVKLEIIKAVQAVLDVPIANIEVLVGK